MVLAPTGIARTYVEDELDTSESNAITQAHLIYSEFVKDGKPFAHALMASKVIDVSIDEVISFLLSDFKNKISLISDLRSTLVEPFLSNLDLFPKIIEIIDTNNITLSYELDSLSDKSKAAFTDVLRTVFSEIPIRQRGHDKLESSRIIREFREGRRKHFTELLVENGHANLVIDKQTLDERAGSARLRGKENFWARDAEEISAIVDMYHLLYYYETPNGERLPYEDIAKILNIEFGTGRRAINGESLRTYVKTNPQLFPKKTKDEIMKYRSGTRLYKKNKFLNSNLVEA